MHEITVIPTFRSSTVINIAWYCNSQRLKVSQITANPFGLLGSLPWHGILLHGFRGEKVVRTSKATIIECKWCLRRCLRWYRCFVINIRWDLRGSLPPGAHFLVYMCHTEVRQTSVALGCSLFFRSPLPRLITWSSTSTRTCRTMTGASGSLRTVSCRSGVHGQTSQHF